MPGLWRRPGGGFDGGGIAGDELGIDLIGLGELTEGPGEAPDLEGCHDDDGQASGEGGLDEGLLEAAGGFDDDALEAVASQAADECRNSLLRVLDLECELSFEEVDVEVGFADVDADVDGRSLLCHGYSSLLNSGSWGPFDCSSCHAGFDESRALVNGL